MSTDVEKKKQAVIAARSLPEFLDSVKLRNKVMKDVTLAELNKDTGMNKCLEWLDNRFKKDENTGGFKYFKEWMSLEHDPSKHKTIEELIDHYNEVVSEAESKGVNNFEVMKDYIDYWRHVTCLMWRSSLYFLNLISKNRRTLYSGS